MSAILTVTIAGAMYQVHGGQTAIQTLWETGCRQVRGIGCLGGACGACSFSYKLAGEGAWRTGLACQTLIRDGMTFNPPPLAEAPSLPPAPPISEIKDPGASVRQRFPELKRCTACNACTLVCPQGIDVRGIVQSAARGRLAEAAEPFSPCVMCGLCAVVCDVGIRPQLAGLWSRRVYAAREVPVPTELGERIRALREGRFDPEWEDLFACGR